MGKYRKRIVTFDIHEDDLAELSSDLNNIPTVFQKRPNGLISGISSCEDVEYFYDATNGNGNYTLVDVSFSYDQAVVKFEEISKLFEQLAQMLDGHIRVSTIDQNRLGFKLYFGTRDSSIISKIRKVAKSLWLETYNDGGIYVFFKDTNELLKFKLVLSEIFPPRWIHLCSI